MSSSDLREWMRAVFSACHSLILLILAEVVASSISWDSWRAAAAALTIRAASEGQWGERLYVRVRNSSKFGTNLVDEPMGWNASPRVCDHPCRRVEPDRRRGGETHSMATLS